MKLKIKRILKITGFALIGLFLLANIALFYAGNHFYNIGMRPNTHRVKENLVKTGIQPKTMTIESPFGYKLEGLYFKNPKPTENTIIIVHGRTQNMDVSVERYGWLFLELGWNILVYDSRFHGRSGGNDISYGYYEKFDLDKWVDLVRILNPKGIIGVHGELLGAATALLHAAMNEKKQRVKFYIADCAYSDLKEILAYHLKNDYHIPVFPILYYADLVTKIRSGYFFGDVSPIKGIKNVDTPVLFIHGDADRYILPEMSEKMYEVKPGLRDIMIVRGAGHAFSVYQAHMGI